LCINVSPSIIHTTPAKDISDVLRHSQPPRIPWRLPKLWKSSGKTGAEEASALMSLSYDRYLKAGDLYEGYDEDGGNLGLEGTGRAEEEFKVW